MATKYGVNATKRANQTIPDLESQGEKNSPVKLAFDSYTLTADLAANDVIKLMKLPAGARVINVWLGFDAMGAGTVNLGWEANSVDGASAAGFLSSVAVTSAGAQDMQGDQPTVAGMFKQFSPLGGETQVSLTIATDTSATSGSYKVAIMYVID